MNTNTQKNVVTNLEWLQEAIANAFEEQARPKYKNNTWLKQKDLTSNERIIMQLVDEKNSEFTNKWLCDQTGFTRKCIRENLAKLMDKRLVNKIGNTHKFKTISIV